VIAVDTNILVYAHLRETPRHTAAFDALAGLAAGRQSWAVPWPCVHEFLAVVTNPRIYTRPSTTADALAAVADLRRSGAALLAESADHLDTLGAMLVDAGVVGARVHDARIAAICLGHGVTELWTADRDFTYFPKLRTRNPLVRR